MPVKGRPVRYKVGFNTKAFYKEYKRTQRIKKRKKVPYMLFKSILMDCNILIRDIIVNESEELKLPFIGSLCIRKVLMSDGKYPIDQRRSKELGFTVYIEDNKYYRYYWRKHKNLFSGCLYSFVPDRNNRAYLSQAIKAGKEYYTS